MKSSLFKSSERGHANHGWLDSYHTFSFADWYNPDRLGFASLRVLNDDIVAPSQGFGTHPHANMEIVSIPLYGTLAHKDSTGTQKNIITGDVQIMSAGTGVYHSEFNASDSEDVNFLQIWIYPKQMNIPPRYDQKTFDKSDRKNNFQLVVAPNSNNALYINQDAYLSLGDFDENLEFNYNLNLTTNSVFLFLIEGKIEVDGKILEKRDAIGINSTSSFNIKSLDKSEILIIEVPER